MSKSKAWLREVVARVLNKPLTKQTYLQERVEELIDVAVDYGRNPTPANELALAEASELLYKAIEKFIELRKN